MLVRDRMTRQPLVVVTPETSIIEARQLMQERNVWHLPVVAQAPVPGAERCDQLVGLLTRSTILQAVPWSTTSLSALETRYVLSKIKVEKVMNRNVMTTTEEVAVEEAARMMVDHKIGCLPVVREGILVGIITGTDLLATLVQMIGARQPGLRLSVTVSNVVGAMARLSSSIAAAGGNLRAFSSWEAAQGPSRLGVVRKVEGLTKEQLIEVVTGLQDVELLRVLGE